MSLMSAERARLKVFAFDEGWRLLGDPVGRMLLASLQRMGRSELAVPIISTQLVARHPARRTGDAREPDRRDLRVRASLRTRGRAGARAPRRRPGRSRASRSAPPVRRGAVPDARSPRPRRGGADRDPRSASAACALHHAGRAVTRVPLGRRARPCAPAGGARRPVRAATAAAGSVAASPLAANGLSSPSCTSAALSAQLSASQRTNCAVSGVAVAPVPLSNYAIDVDIPSGSERASPRTATRSCRTCSSRRSGRPLCGSSTSCSSRSSGATRSTSSRRRRSGARPPRSPARSASSPIRGSGSRSPSRRSDLRGRASSDDSVLDTLGRAALMASDGHGWPLGDRRPCRDRRRGGRDGRQGGACDRRGERDGRSQPTRIDRRRRARQRLRRRNHGPGRYLEFGDVDWCRRSFRARSAAARGRGSSSSRSTAPAPTCRGPSPGLVQCAPGRERPPAAALRRRYGTRAGAHQRRPVPRGSGRRDAADRADRPLRRRSSGRSAASTQSDRLHGADRAAGRVPQRVGNLAAHRRPGADRRGLARDAAASRVHRHATPRSGPGDASLPADRTARGARARARGQRSRHVPALARPPRRRPSLEARLLRRARRASCSWRRCSTRSTGSDGGPSGCWSQVFWWTAFEHRHRILGLVLHERGEPTHRPPLSNRLWRASRTVGAGAAIGWAARDIVVRSGAAGVDVVRRGRELPEAPLVASSGRDPTRRMRARDELQAQVQRVATIERPRPDSSARAARLDAALVQARAQGDRRREVSLLARRERVRAEQAPAARRLERVLPPVAQRALAVRERRRALDRAATRRLPRSDAELAPLAGLAGLSPSEYRERPHSARIEVERELDRRRSLLAEAESAPRRVVRVALDRAPLTARQRQFDRRMR